MRQHILQTSPVSTLWSKVVCMSRSGATSRKVCCCTLTHQWSNSLYRRTRPITTRLLSTGTNLEWLLCLISCRIFCERPDAQMNPNLHQPDQWGSQSLHDSSNLVWSISYLCECHMPGLTIKNNNSLVNDETKIFVNETFEDRFGTEQTTVNWLQVN